MTTYLLNVKKHVPNPKAGEHVYGTGGYGGHETQPDTLETRAMEVELTEAEFERLRCALLETWDSAND